MHEGREWESTGRIIGATAQERPERLRPQVEVIREPNEIDEADLVEPNPAE